MVQVGRCTATAAPAAGKAETGMHHTPSLGSKLQFVHLMSQQACLKRMGPAGSGKRPRPLRPLPLPPMGPMSGGGPFSAMYLPSPCT